MTKAPAIRYTTDPHERSSWPLPPEDPGLIWGRWQVGTSKGKRGPPGVGATYLATRGSGETPVLEVGEGFLPAEALRACSENRPSPWFSAPQLGIDAGSAECFWLGRRELSRKGETAGGLWGWIHGWEAGQRLQAHLPASQALHRPLPAQPGSLGPPACVELQGPSW